MKVEREHRVPLSAAALSILKQMQAIREDDFVFPGGKKGKPLSNMAMPAVLKRMGRGDVTAHGFRSSFRDWTAKSTNFPHEVAEMALAVGDKVEAAYRRGDLFQKRRQLAESLGKVLRHPTELRSSGKGCGARSSLVDLIGLSTLSVLTKIS